MLPDDERNSSLTINLNNQDGNLNQEFSLDGSMLTADFGELFVFAFTISAVYNALPYSNGALKCSQDETLEDCQDSCRSTTIQKYCNCMAVSWPRLTANSKQFCTIDDYMNCLQLSKLNGQINLTFQNEMSTCASNCLPYCTLVKYVQTLQKSSVEADQAEIVLRVLHFSYFIYSEHYLHTSSTFIAEFGGYIILWVGLDFLLLTHIIYLALCGLLRFIMILFKKTPVCDKEETPIVSLERDIMNNRVLPPAQDYDRILRVVSLKYD
jgi:hypothetical protein